MSNARIGFSTSLLPNAISTAISVLTKDEASHTYFVFQDETLGLEVVMESAPIGFRIIPYIQWKKDNKVLDEYSIPNLDEGVKWAANELGRPYDYSGLFGMIIVLIGRWLKVKWNNPSQSSGASFCSELACKTLQAMSWPPVIPLIPSDTSPAELHSIFKNQK